MNHMPFIFGAFLSFVALLGASLLAGQPKQVEASIEQPVVQTLQPVKDELLGDSVSYTIAKNSYVVVDVNEVSSWWYNDSAKTFIDFINGETHTAYEMSRIKNVSVDLNAFAYKATSAITFDMAIIVRGTTGFASGPDWSDNVCWNQTIDIVPSSAEQTNAIYIRDYKAWGTNKYEAYFGGDEILANEYSRYFLTQSLCKDEGGIVSGASNTWTTLRTFYSNYVSGKFVTSDYLSNYVLTDEDNSYTANMLRRYEAIIRKNDTNYGDYLNRGITKNQPVIAGLFANSTAENGNYALIIILGSLALIATAAIFMHIKRREA